MRKIIVLLFVTLDGIMQAPGGPQEDTDGSFNYGGWIVPHFDERLGAILHAQAADGATRRRSRAKISLTRHRLFSIFISPKKEFLSQIKDLNHMLPNRKKIIMNGVLPISGNLNFWLPFSWRKAGCK